MCNIWSGITDITVHLAHDTDMFIAVEQRVLLLALTAWSIAAKGGFVGLQTGIR